CCEQYVLKTPHKSFGTSGWPHIILKVSAVVEWFHFSTGLIKVMANQPDIVVVDKEQRKAVVVDVAIPSDHNIRKKEHEKLEKYQGLREELEKAWKVKTTVVPVVIG
uniref:Uncharacterized protein n=1 Tax=Poecilia formosa TaxID=48698 RepID=A0A096M1X3_POEFO